MGDKTNVLFIFADDQRFDTIRALGNEEIYTPNMDALIAEGTCFTNAHIPGGSSGAVCMPSRAMLHTGRSLFTIKDEGQSIDETHTLMGEMFQEKGYECFGTGKWHNGSKSYARSFTCGDNIFFGGMHDHWCVPVHSFDPTGNYHGRVKQTPNFFYDNKPLNLVADKINVGQHSTDFLTEGLLNYIKEDHEKPFFAYMALLAPHDPRTMPGEFRDLYKAEDITLPPNFQSFHHIEYGNTDCRDEVLAPYPRTLEDTKKQIAEYYAMISHIDYQLGRVIKTLKEEGLYENTLIVYAADNGLAVGQHGLFGKQSLYEHSVRVPLIFAGKGIEKDVRRDQIVCLYDIFPTLCDLLGFEIPETVNGKSFAPCFKHAEHITRESLYLMYTDKIRAIKKDGYKYVQHRHKDIVTHSLFHLASDPYEMANLYQNPELKEFIVSLQECLVEEGKNSNEYNNFLGRNYWGSTATS